MSQCLILHEDPQIELAEAIIHALAQTKITTQDSVRSTGRDFFLTRFSYLAEKPASNLLENKEGMQENKETVFSREFKTILFKTL